MKASGFSFQAPSGWKVERARTQATASQGGHLVQVTTFRLVKRYTDSLFTKVAPELRSRMDALARQTGGRVTGEKTVTAAGRRAHMYVLTGPEHVDEYTFVLDGKREYQLLCRRPVGEQTDYCAQLIKSFST